MKKQKLIFTLFLFSLICVPALLMASDKELVVLKKNENKITTQKIQEIENINDAINEIKQDPSVDIVEPNFTRKILTAPNDQYFDDQWYLYQPNDIDMDSKKAWRITTGGSDTVIAIIDTGVDLDHEDLANKIWINENEIADNGIDDDDNGYIDDVNGWDFVNNNNDPNPDPTGNDDSGITHGTHVAGIAAASTNNNTGISGVCWNCQIMPIQVMDSEGMGEIDGIYNGIMYAVNNGADVINLSFGSYDYSATEKRAIDAARAKQIIVVAAAGNDSNNLNDEPIYPACNKGVLAVAATNKNDKQASYSNYGSGCVDVSAPGSLLLSSLYTNDHAYNFLTDYGYMSGTSMATPLVSGLAGLLKSLTPMLPKKQIADYIRDGAEKKELGEKMGAGRINLYNSVRLANAYLKPQAPKTIRAYTGEKMKYEILAKTASSEQTPLFKWSKSTTNVGSIIGYYVYWGTNKNANPKKVGTFQTSRKYHVRGKQKISKKFNTVYYLIVKAKNSDNKVSKKSKRFKFIYQP
ncbi:MAG: S8 family serine peptidase [Patescibacteria group bacterium]